MTRYFFDISGVLEYLRHGARFTGIQRVVVTLTDAACRQLPAGQAFVSYYDFRKETYVALPFKALQEGTLCDPNLLRAAFGITSRRPAQGGDLSEKYKGRPLRAAYHTLRRDIYARAGRRKYQPPRLDRERLSPPDIRRVQMADMVAFRKIAEAGDHLVIMDAVWNMVEVLSVFREIRAAGVIVHTMLHDLIPIVAPQFANDDVLMAFESWLRSSGAYSTTYLAVSESTGRDLRAFWEGEGIDGQVSVVPLAQATLASLKQAEDIDQSDMRRRAILSSQRVRALLARPYVLCVGTLEIRKNVWQIAQAWQRLSKVEDIILPKLVFAGQKGWMIQDFDRMIKASGHLSGWVEIIEGASDAELEALYQNCLFTITASFYEGWGLPIGESLAYGKTAVVSKTSSMPEVGGDLVEYCDPHSIKSIQQACHKLITDSQYREGLEARIKAAELRQWDDTARHLLKVIDTQPSQN